jgi:hypothetical protein
MSAKPIFMTIITAMCGLLATGSAGAEGREDGESVKPRVQGGEGMNRWKEVASSESHGMRKAWIGVAAVLALTLLAPTGARAQGDGPRSQLLMPTGINLVVPAYLGLSGNMNFGQTILVPDAEIDSDIWVVTYTRAFSFGGRYAQFWINPIAGSIDGRATLTHPVSGERVTVNVSESGLADPVVSFKLGLVGAPALALPEFAKTPQGFQLSAFVSASLPWGDYDSERPLNLGTNVLALRFGAPMVFPMGDPKAPFFFELFPSVAFYEDNDDPSGGAQEREQDPLFMVESHLSHNFTPKFWASFDLRYRKGGETTTDGSDDGNAQDVLGGGVSLGYSFTKFLSMQATYGNVLTENDGTELEMVRVKLALMF